MRRYILKDMNSIRFIEKDDTQNSYIVIDNFAYRCRVYNMIIKDKSNIFILYKNNEIEFPGGSIEPRLSIEETAIKETQEEGSINVKNCKFSGESYLEFSNKPNKKYDHGIDYKGYLQFICISEYDGIYEGKVNEVDKDNYMKENIKEYSIEKVYPYLNEYQKIALDKYLKYNNPTLYLKVKNTHLNESDIIISKKDIEYKTEDFYNGTEDILLITGYSGSGKTTSSYNIKSKIDNCEIIHLDDLYNVIKEKTKDNTFSTSMVKLFLSKNNINKNNYFNISRETIHTDFVKFIIDNRKNKKIIIEGIQILYIYEFLDYKYPIIIKNTSVIKSLYNSIKREGDLILFIKKYKNNIKNWYFDSDKDNLIKLKDKTIDIIKEDKLSSKERDILDDKEFGIPELRKFPLNDENHLKSAISYFHTCPDKYKNTLAKNILKKHKEYDIEPNKDSMWYKYIKEDISIENYLKEISDSFNYIDLTKDNIILEDNNPLDSNKYDMVYIVLTSTDTILGKTIKRMTNTKYNHASLAFETDLKRMYSFGRGDVKKTGGFDIESIDNTYIKKFGSVPFQLYGVVLPEEKILEMKLKLNEYLLRMDKLGYSKLGLIGYLLNRPIKVNDAMFCSEFVDAMFKSVGVDITHKDSGLIHPVDFAIKNRKDHRVFKLYDGNMNRYKPSMISSKVVQGIKIYVAKYLKESSIIQEVKKFPVQFDKEGNLIIKNISKLDFEEEYQKSHKLLLMYEKTNNLEGMKYELSKLWYINTAIEIKINSKDIDKNTKKKLLKLRSRILNDFYKYLKIVSVNDFNFTEYYEASPFSDSEIMFGKDSINGLINIIKYSLI